VSLAPFQAAHNRTTGPRQDPREIPLYDVSEAAQFVGVSSAALDGWMHRPANDASAPPLLEVVDAARNRLSFANLVEAHILEATRKHRVSSSELRVVVKAIRRQEPGTQHPLLTRRFRDLAGGLDRYFERIDWDINDDPYQLFPMRHNMKRYVALNIGLSAGHPVVAGSGVRVQHLSDLIRAGESVSSVANRYGLKERSVAGALAFLLHGSK
jgi:uncharacterized protein (DUF433 family)